MFITHGANLLVKLEVRPFAKREENASRSRGLRKTVRICH